MLTRLSCWILLVALWAQGASGEWVEQATSAQTLHVVQAVTEEVAWVAGNDGCVMRTTDGGGSWQLRSVPGAVNIRGIFAFDGSLCNVADQSGALWQSTDGGSQWHPVRDSSGSSINAIHFFNSVEGIAVGDPVNGVFQILETNDGGSTWVQSPSAPSAMPPTIGFSRCLAWAGDVGLFGTSEYLVWRTTDRGATWDSVRTAISYVFAIVLDESGIGYSGGSGGGGVTLIRSSDFGATWEPWTNPANAVLKPSDWIDGTGEIWGVTTQDGLYQSTNAGQSWAQHILAPPFTLVYEDVDFVSEDVGWCVGFSGNTGRIFRYSSTTAVGDASPKEMQIRAFPNPFHSYTAIGFAKERSDLIRVTIRDALGRTLRRIDVMQSHGSTEVLWDGRNAGGQSVAAGVYYYDVNGRESGRVVKLAEGGF